MAAEHCVQNREKILVDLMKQLAQMNGRSHQEMPLAVENLTKIMESTEPTAFVPCDEDILTKDQSLDLAYNDYEQMYVRVAQSLYSYAAIPHYGNHEDFDYDMNDFFGISEKAEKSMQCFKCIFVKFTSLSTVRAREFLSRILPSMTLKALLLMAEHFSKQLWTSSNSIAISADLATAICKVCDCNSITEVLCAPGKDSVLVRGLFGTVLSEVKPKLKRDNWKQYPSIKCVFQWCLFNSGFPHLSEHLDSVLPAALLFVDDYKQEHKVLGVKCLQFVITNISGSQLQWYGRADVVYEALQHLLYTHEVELLCVLFPCLLHILQVVESSPLKTDQPRTEGKYDILLQRILDDMETETKLVLRRVYAEHLTMFVDKMGITLVRHFKKLFRVIFSYLEVYDGPCESARLYILDTVKAVIRLTWPRIPGHCDAILKALLKLLYDISTDKTLTPQPVKDQLLAKTVDCLIRLKKICGTKVVSHCQALDSVGVNDICKNSLKKVLQDSS